MAPISSKILDTALHVLEEQLRLAGSSPIRLVVCGGSALIALALVLRTTKDVDVLALSSATGELYSAEPLPDSLKKAAEVTANALRLPIDWLNAGPASLFSMGLPEGLSKRLSQVNIGPSLTVLYVSRIDQIYFKLYAAVDRGGYHISDLSILSPTSNELFDAAQWTMTHDVSEGFREMLKQLLTTMEHDDVAQRI